MVGIDIDQILRIPGISLQCSRSSSVSGECEAERRNWRSTPQAESEGGESA